MKEKYKCREKKFNEEFKNDLYNFINEINANFKEEQQHFTSENL